MWKTEKNLHVENAVHIAARALERFLESVHRAGDVFFERVCHENMIFPWIAIIRAGA